MKNIPEFQLIYFNLRALAEAPQMMMRYADIKYSYKMAWDFYGRPWRDAKEDVPFNQLPILVIDKKKHIWQSGAIIRYLSKYTNTEPKGHLLKAEVDAVHEQSYELFIPLNPIVNLMVDETHIKYKKKFLGKIPINIDLRISADSGKPLVQIKPDHVISKIFLDMAKKINVSFVQDDKIKEKI